MAPYGTAKSDVACIVEALSEELWLQDFGQSWGSDPHRHWGREERSLRRQEQLNGWLFFLHIEAIPQLNLLEWIFNTPIISRTSCQQFRKAGLLLFIWDRLFSTIAPEGDVINSDSLVGKRAGG